MKKNIQLIVTCLIFAILFSIALNNTKNNLTQNKFQTRNYFNTSILNDVSAQDAESLKALINKCLSNPACEETIFQSKIRSFQIVETFSFNGGEAEYVFLNNPYLLCIYDDYDHPRNIQYFELTEEEYWFASTIYGRNEGSDTP